MHFADVVHTTSLWGLRDLHIHNRCHISCLQRGEKQATLSFGAKRSRLRSYTLHTGKLEADQRDAVICVCWGHSWLRSPQRFNEIYSPGDSALLSTSVTSFFLPRLEGSEPFQHWNDGSLASFTRRWSGEGPSATAGPHRSSCFW